MFRDAHHGKPCKYCQRPMNSRDARLQPTRDHVLPVSRGGRVKVVCCLTCNGIKADMLPNQWELFMAENPGWWALSKYELRNLKRAALGLQPRRKIIAKKRAAKRVAIRVPPELIYGDVNGHGQKRDTDAGTAVVASSEKLEESVLEERAQSCAA